MRTYTPHRDYLIVQQDPSETSYGSSGLEIPEWWQRAEPRAKVLWVGVDVMLYDPNIVPGAHVRFSEHTGRPMSVREDGVEHHWLVLHRDDLWAVELTDAEPAEAELDTVAA